MKWNQKKLITASRKAAKEKNIRDFDGKSAEDFVAWTKTHNLEFEGLADDAAVTVAFKMVTITADAGEEIVVEDASADGEEDAKAADEVDDIDIEDEEATKAFLAERRSQRKSMRSLQDQSLGMKGIRQAAIDSMPGTPAIHNGAEKRAMKMYNNSVNNGTPLSNGKMPKFTDAEISQKYGAAVRVMAAKGHYKQLANDCSIIGLKAGSTTDNAYAASLIVHETSMDMIDNLHQYGALRNLMPTTSMPDGVFSIPRKTADMAFSYRLENGAYASTNPTVDLVKLTAHDAGGIAVVSNNLLKDSAFSIGEMIAESTNSGRGKFEDADYFNGTYGTHGGLLGTTGADANSIYDATLSSGWEDYTIQKLQAWRGMVPADAWSSGTVKVVCSTAFLQSVLYTFALSSGGTTGDRMLLGVTNGVLSWDGIPVVLSESLPSTYSANQISAYIGSFERGTKFGVVDGSEELSTSDQRYWDLGQFAWRFDERIAFNFHDAAGTGSQIIALKD